MQYIRIRYLHSTVDNEVLPLDFYNKLFKVIEEKEDTVIVNCNGEYLEFRKQSIERWI